MIKRVRAENINTKEYLNTNYSGANWRHGWEDADRRIREEIGLAIPQRILDVGCADGTFIKEFISKSPTTKGYGVDISDAAIERAKENFSEGEFSVGSCYELPFEDGFFDLVHSSEMLEHLEEPVKALQEMTRVVKRGGEVVITTVNEHAAPYEEHLWTWDLKGVLEMVVAAGLVPSLALEKFFNDSILYVKAVKI